MRGCITHFHAFELRWSMNEILDGRDVIRREMSVRDIAQYIERTARWVAPETFELLPLWFPEYARRSPFFKCNWSEPQSNTNRRTGVSIHKLESNRYASRALMLALGVSKRPSNWSCCHIWSVDDPTFQLSNEIVVDRRYYSCVGNMLLLPTPLKAFTDSMPEIKTMLRICARNLYNWHCDHDSLLAANAALTIWEDWTAYPESWPRFPGEKRPRGIVPRSSAIERCAKSRLNQIRKDLATAGEFYPREEVRSALAYWGIEA
ncbi:hypothetical protein [Bradyrhizobium sp. STM 3843]|uniref:hypothetical protein n=1 Tax=Bradyrhizobium sp. STM 3843 TaxID=551947 RepID=UPI001FCAFC90|nr:hypothetical protein [Bradyrhizobium sp. STM 3843]